jgi:WhiB family transcriptional regulator, redox-sensing transcriptional regulator
MARNKQTEEQSERTFDRPLSEDYSWQAEGACRGADPELFFPPTEEEAAVAKGFCAICPVRLTCLAFAIERNERFGVWGGLAEKERAKLSPAAREQIRRQAAA